MRHKHIILSVAMAALVLVSLCAAGASTLSVGATQVSSSYVKTPTIVGAPVGSGAPAVCSPDGKGLDLFIRGADNYCYLKISTDGTTWPSTSQLLGGSMTSAPAATVRDSTTGTVTVFARGQNGSIYYRDGSGTSFGPWTCIGGQVPVNVGPAVCSWGSGRLDVFVQCINGAMYHRSYTPQSGWAKDWDNLGGRLTSAPAATAMASSPNEIGVFVAGVNSILYFRDYKSSTGWGSWTAVTGAIAPKTSPAAYNWGPTHIGWFITDTNYQLDHYWSGTSNGHEDLGGALTSSPAATAKSPGVIDAFGRGSTSTFAALYQISYNYPANPGQWGVWTAIGGV